MRNVFDQYDQAENRLTHAVACTLSEDRKLIRPFLHWIGIAEVPRAEELLLVEQQLPGEMQSGDEADAKGLPDICISTDEGWCVVFECKVQSPTGADQLRRHRNTTRRCGYRDPHLVVLSVDSPSELVSRLAHFKPWREVYSWFRGRRSESVWAGVLTDYMEVFESRMLGVGYGIRGTITMFDGLKFDDDHPYAYREAKRLIRLLGDALRIRKDLRRLGVDPDGLGRGAITGSRGDAVWDFLPLMHSRGSTAFTNHPHLTMGIQRQFTAAAVTVPNGIKGGFRSDLREAEYDGFCSMLLEVERNLRPLVRRSKDAKPIVYVVQRHYRSQRSHPEIDARLEADLRTLKKTKSKVKYQPQWGRAIYDALVQKRSNIQLGVEVRFSYQCPIVRSPEAVDLYAEAWIAMKPLIDFVVK